jgi:hypothetical protein
VESKPKKQVKKVIRKLFCQATGGRQKGKCEGKWGFSVSKYTVYMFGNIAMKLPCTVNIC